MKKKLTASVLACALALAMPAAAFAAESIEADSAAGKGAAKVQTIDTKGQIENLNQIQVVGNVLNGVTAKPVASVDEGVADVAAQFEASLADKVANEEMTEDQAAQAALDWAKKALEYNQTIDKYMETQGAEQINTFVMHGTVKEGAALVSYTFDTNNVKPGSKVTYVILHEDGTIQKATTVVGNDGMIKIKMGSFSAITFISTPAVAVTPDNIYGDNAAAASDNAAAAAEKNLTTVDAPQKGVSPQTGC